MTRPGVGLIGHARILRPGRRGGPPRDLAAPPARSTQSLAEALAAEVTSLEQGGAVEESECVSRASRPALARVEAGRVPDRSGGALERRKHARARARVVLGTASARCGCWWRTTAEDRAGRAGAAWTAVWLGGIRQRAALIGADVEMDAAAGGPVRLFVPERPIVQRSK